MRSVFDQFRGRENQLTHALMSALQQDRALAASFLRLIGLPQKPSRPRFLQQSLPGELDLPSEEEADRRGLPDGVIFEPDRYTVLIETKVAAPPSADQLRRHLSTARRKGFAEPRVVLLTLKPLAFSAPWLTVRNWSQVYVWLCAQPRRLWTKELLTFLEAREARWSAEGYLREGTLTTFAGIPFDHDEPYDYFQAKRLIRLMREELVRHPDLVGLSADLKGPGRPAIRGRGDNVVWDMIPIRQPATIDGFTQNVHLTFAILRDRLQACVTVPNNIRSRRRTQLLGPSLEAFADRLTSVVRGLQPVLRSERHAQPYVAVVQRRYASRSAKPQQDASLDFDPRTYVRARSTPVRHQPQWLMATYEALRHRRSNLQLQVGVNFPFDKCPGVRTPAAVDLVARVWKACRPVIDAIRD